MKLKITEHAMYNGNQFEVIPLDESFPDKLTVAGSNVIIEVSETQGAAILKAQSMTIEFHAEMAKKFYDAKFKNVTGFKITRNGKPNE